MSAEEKDAASCPCEFCDAARDRKLQDRKKSEAEAAIAAAARDGERSGRRERLTSGRTDSVMYSILWSSFLDGASMKCENKANEDDWCSTFVDEPSLYATTWGIGE